MDVLYYLSPHFGQLIVNRVTEELNTKYQVFMDEHPGTCVYLSPLKISLPVIKMNHQYRMERTDLDFCTFTRIGHYL